MFISELKKSLRFTNTHYTKGTDKPEKPVMTTDKYHLKCHCVDGSIVNGIREQFFSFKLSAPPRYMNMKEPNNVSHEKINKTRLDITQFSLEDSNYHPIDFNSGTLTLKIQIVKI